MHKAHCLPVTLVVLLSLLASASAENRTLTLEVAARKGDLQTVRQLLDSGADPRQRDINGSTALHAAARGGQLQVMKLLLSSGADPDLADEQGRRPLYEAASAGSMECCRLLIEEGASLEAPTVGGWTPLTATMYWGSDECTIYLLELGAEMTLHDDIPLLVASRRGYPLTLKRLLKEGASVGMRDESGRTALHFAILSGETEVVEILLAAGADCETPDESGLTPLQMAAADSRAESLERMLLRAKKPEQALPSACASGRSEIVRRLLPLVGAEVPDECWRAAANRQDFEMACRVLEVLLSQAKPDQKALTAATRVGNLEAVRLLLNAGANATDKVALVAAELARPEVLKLLLDSGAGRPSLPEVEKRWKEFEQLLQDIIERYSGRRSLHPAESHARSELERLNRSKDEVVRLLSTDQ